MCFNYINANFFEQCPYAILIVSLNKFIEVSKQTNRIAKATGSSD